MEGRERRQRRSAYGSNNVQTHLAPSKAFIGRSTACRRPSTGAEMEEFQTSTCRLFTRQKKATESKLEEGSGRADCYCA